MSIGLFWINYACLSIENTIKTIFFKYSYHLINMKLKTLNWNDHDRHEFGEHLISGLKKNGMIILKKVPCQENNLKQIKESFFSFSNQDDDIKSKYNELENTFGYSKETNSESIQFSRKGQITEDPAIDYPENLITDPITFQNYYKIADSFSSLILRKIGRGLQIQEDYFPNLIERGYSKLKLTFYSIIKKNNPSKEIQDTSLITIHFSIPKNFQLLTPEGNWESVSLEKDEILVSSGTILSRVTNNKLKAAEYRISSCIKKNDRIHILFYIIPHPNSQITKIYPPTERPLFKSIKASSLN